MGFWGGWLASFPVVWPARRVCSLELISRIYQPFSCPQQISHGQTNKTSFTGCDQRWMAVVPEKDEEGA